MADVLTKQQRSHCMSMIRGRDTGPEMKLRKALWSEGLRYRLKSNLPGRPDFVFPGTKLAVFVDGCFWHGCDEHCQLPGTNTEFWLKKINGNIERDKHVKFELENSGWAVIRFWEHEVRKNLQRCIRTVAERVSMARTFLQIE